MIQLNVLYEDNHLLAINKPAGLATMGTDAGKATAARLCQAYLKERYRKPGNVYLGVVSRLDAVASGVLLFARTSKAAARLSQQFREGEATKQYLILVEGIIEPAEGELTNWLIKDERQQRMAITSQGARQAKLALLRYRCLKMTPDQASLTEVDLLTGRKHQIRVQFAAVGHPIVGDQKYGSRRKFPGTSWGPAIALHARRLVISHPVKHAPLEIVGALPKSWQRQGALGDADA